MMDGIARGFFSTHDMYANNSISSYYFIELWTTMPQINRDITS